MKNTYSNELDITRRILDKLFADGYTVRVDDDPVCGAGDIEKVATTDAAIEFLTWNRPADDGGPTWSVDEAAIRVSKEGSRGRWVYLVFGNGNEGLDVVADYSTGLSEILDPIIGGVYAAETLATLIESVTEDIKKGGKIKPAFRPIDKENE